MPACSHWSSPSLGHDAPGRGACATRDGASGKGAQVTGVSEPQSQVTRDRSFPSKCKHTPSHPRGENTRNLFSYQSSRGTFCPSQSECPSISLKFSIQPPKYLAQNLSDNRAWQPQPVKPWAQRENLTISSHSPLATFCGATFGPTISKGWQKGNMHVRSHL